MDDSTIVYESQRKNGWRLFSLNIYTKESKIIIGKPYNPKNPIAF